MKGGLLAKIDKARLLLLACKDAPDAKGFVDVAKAARNVRANEESF